jgi:hypothetical protein
MAARMSVALVTLAADKLFVFNILRLKPLGLKILQAGF